MGCANTKPEKNAKETAASSKKGGAANGAPRQKATPKHRLAENMIVKQRGDPKDNYTIVKRLGRGSISTIFLVQKKMAAKNGVGNASGSMRPQPGGGLHRQSSLRVEDELYALKEIDMELVQPSFIIEMKNEINVLKTIDHPNILKAYEVYESHIGTVSVIMEYCSGGDLGKRAPCSEERSKIIVAKIVEAVHYLHVRNIMHRDLKFENIMFESEAEDAEPKLIDFGLAQKYAKSEHFHEKVGTIYTMSPQAIQGDYDKQTDIWSIGVVAYMLLVGRPPFWGESRREVARKVVEGRYNMSGPKWDAISYEAKQFVTRCLEVDPARRYTAEQALQSLWLREVEDISRFALKKQSSISVLQHMNEEVDDSEFRKVVLQNIAHKVSSHDEILKLRHVFHSLDADHDGNITLEELRTGIHRVENLGMDEETIVQWFEHADADAGGEISYTEFIAALLETQIKLEEDRVVEAFETLDRDNSGYISRRNLKDALGVGSTKNPYLEQLLQEADTDGDGQISFQEFKAAMDRQNERDRATVSLDQQQHNSSQSKLQKEQHPEQPVNSHVSGFAEI